MGNYQNTTGPRIEEPESPTVASLAAPLAAAGRDSTICAGGVSGFFELLSPEKY
jgi:hypothetical protein